MPYVIEQTGGNERQYDIYSRLLKDRIIMLTGEINDEVASSIIGQMLFLQSEDPKKDVNLYINSPGGVVTAGLAIYDVMQMMPYDINTFCIGQAASMGAVLLTAGTAGKRHSLKNSRIMIHQPSGGARGTAADITIQAEEINRLKSTLYEILSKHTGKPVKTILKDSERDFFISAEEALKYGVIDKII
jgi:ATP-dependent Clp protease protease subunit